MYCIVLYCILCFLQVYLRTARISKFEEDETTALNEIANGYENAQNGDDEQEENFINVQLPDNFSVDIGVGAGDDDDDDDDEDEDDYRDVYVSAYLTPQVPPTD